MDSYLLQIFNGISVSSVLLLAALGLAITFGLMRIINMAHGEMIMIGAIYHVYGAKLIYIIFGRKIFRTVFYCGNTSFVPDYRICRLFAGDFNCKTPVRQDFGQFIGHMGNKPYTSAVSQKHFRCTQCRCEKSKMAERGVVVFGNIQLPYKRLFIILLAALCIAGVYLFLFKATAEEG